MLLEELSETLSKGRHLTRLQVRLGAKDVAYVGDIMQEQEPPRRVDLMYGGIEVPLFSPPAHLRWSSALIGVDLAQRWAHGDVLLLVESGVVDRLRTSHRVVTMDAAAVNLELPPVMTNKHHLIIVVDPRSQRGPVVTQLQTVMSRLQTRPDVAVVLLNPDLRVPHPLNPGATMKPMLLSDFTTVYVAESDALETPDADAGIALYLRWPHPSYRLYERHLKNFALIGSAPDRPSEDQLKAVFRAYCCDQ